jgi:nucleotide-binding universal stress UspA family protein
MTRVIALIDGSIYSTSVCEHAAWAARRIGASVELLHVIGSHDGGDDAADRSGAIGLGARSALLAELAELDGKRAKLAQQRGRLILDDAKARVEAGGVAEVTTRLRRGDVADAVQGLDDDTRVVILGKRGEAADFARGHLGSNTERVVRACNRPVLAAARAFTPPTRCMIAFDGGTSAMKAVEMAARSPFFADLDIHVLSVGPDTAETRKRLDGAAATLSGAGRAATAHLTQGQPEEAIAAFVDSLKINLLVMGAYGHSRIRSLIIGSTTTEMVRSCKAPVLLFR